jgi:hypothetical protein
VQRFVLSLLDCLRRRLLRLQVLRGERNASNAETQAPKKSQNAAPAKTKSRKRAETWRDQKPRTLCENQKLSAPETPMQVLAENTTKF